MLLSRLSVPLRVLTSFYVSGSVLTGCVARHNVTSFNINGSVNGLCFSSGHHCRPASVGVQKQLDVGEGMPGGTRASQDERGDVSHPRPRRLPLRE